MDTHRLNLLIVEADEGHAEAVRRAFDAAGVAADIRSAGTLREYREQVAAHAPDIALLDLNLPDGRAVEVLTHPPEDAPFPIAVMTAFGNQETVVEVLKAGALDYVVKSPECFAVLPRTVEHMLREWELRQRHKRAEMAVRASEELNKAIFNSVASHLAVLDRNGVIVAVNAPWQRFALENPTPDGQPARNCGTGVNYLEVCRQSTGASAKDAMAAHDGIQAVLAGRTPSFTLEYPCHSPQARRWFSMMVTPLGVAERFAVVAHSNISDRVRVEETLQASEIRYRRLHESMTDAFASVSMDGRIQDSNRAFQAMLGYSAEELKRFTYTDLTPTRWHAMEAKLVEEVILPRGHSEVYEKEYQKRDGTVFPVELRAFLIRDDAGQPASMWAIVRDITERKRAEEELQQSEERFRGLFQDIPSVAVQSYAPDGTTLYWNKASERLYGYTAQEAIGRSLLDLIIPPEMRAGVKQAIQQMAEAGQPIPASELSLMRKDGSRVAVFSSHTLVKIPGRDPEFFCVDVDLTESKQAQEALWQSDQQYRLLADNMADVLWIVELPTIRFLYLSPSVQRLLGYTADELMTQPLDRLLTAPSLAVVLSSLAARTPAFLAGDPTATIQVHEVELIRKDGSTVWTEMVTTFLQNASGGISVLGASRDITERKRLEQEIARMSARYQTILEAEPESVKLISPAGELLEINPAGLKLFEAASLAEAQSQPLSHFIVPEYRAALRALHRRVLQGQSGTAEFECVGLKGGRCWLETHAVPLRDPRSGETNCLSVSRDITARRQAEALKETLFSLATRLSEASTATDVARSVFATVGKLWQWDAATLDTVCSPDATTSQTVLSVDVLEGERREVPPSGLPMPISPRAHRVLKHGPELILRPPGVMPVADSSVFGDTTRLSASIMCVPIRRRGVPVGVLSVQSYTPNAFTPEDLQPLQGLADHCGGALERILAEAQLHRQATLLDAANDAIYVRKLDHTLTYWNHGAERLYGCTRAGALGRKMTELGDRDYAAFEEAHAAFLAQGSWSGELRRTSRTGKEYVVFCRWTLLRDDQGRPAEVLAINTDITEQKQLAASFYRAQRLEAFGSLASGIAHDLNNILTPILMTGSLLQETVRDPESRNLLRMVESCAQRGADIVKQLLTFARGKPGANVPVPVRHLLRDMEKLIRETFSRNIQVQISAPPELWPVQGDPTQIHQTLMNLCVNARDAMPIGGTLTLAAANQTVEAAVPASVLEAKPGNYLCLSVTDTGTGIAPEHLPRIFEPFFTTKEASKGTGLGLASVLGIVRGHGGFMRVQSQVGQGTTFELYLPATPEANHAALLRPAEPAPRGHGEMILVVDDEPGIREVLKLVLETHGYRILTAVQGVEALALLERHRTEVRVILTDLMMPVMDGTALVKAVRRLDSRLPILGMTGLNERTNLTEFKELNVSSILTKPVASHQLLTALQETLRHG